MCMMKNKKNNTAFGKWVKEEIGFIFFSTAFFKSAAWELRGNFKVGRTIQTSWCWQRRLSTQCNYYKVFQGTNKEKKNWISYYNNFDMLSEESFPLTCLHDAKSWWWGVALNKFIMGTRRLKKPSTLTLTDNIEVQLDKGASLWTA